MPRPSAAPPLLNGASILALSTIYDLRLSKTGRTVVGRTFDWMDGRSDAVSRLSGSFLKGTLAGNKANGQSPYALEFGEVPWVRKKFPTTQLEVPSYSLVTI